MQREAKGNQENLATSSRQGALPAQIISSNSIHDRMASGRWLCIFYLIIATALFTWLKLHPSEIRILTRLSTLHKKKGDKESNFTKSTECPGGILGKLAADPNRRIVIFAAGGRKAGSMWQYFALRNIIIHAGLSSTSVILKEPKYHQMANFPTAEAIGKNQILLLKSHAYNSKYDLMASYVFTSYRDMRDQFLSIMHHNIGKCRNNPTGLFRACRRFLDASHRNELLWSKITSYAARAEKMLSQPIPVISEMMDVLGLPYAPADLSFILQKTEENMTRMKAALAVKYNNSDTALPINGISTKPGSYRTKLTPMLIKCINSHYRGWLQSKNYSVVLLPDTTMPKCSL